MTQKRISPYVRMRDEWREWVRTMFVDNSQKKAIAQISVDGFMRGAIATAEALGHVCVAKVEGNTLVIYARPAITTQGLPWDIRPDWTNKETL